MAATTIAGPVELHAAYVCDCEKCYSSEGKYHYNVPKGFVGYAVRPEGTSLTWTDLDMAKKRCREAEQRANELADECGALRAKLKAAYEAIGNEAIGRLMRDRKS